MEFSRFGFVAVGGGEVVLSLSAVVVAWVFNCFILGFVRGVLDSVLKLERADEARSRDVVVAVAVAVKNPFRLCWPLLGISVLARLAGGSDGAVVAVAVNSDRLAGSRFVLVTVVVVMLCEEFVLGRRCKSKRTDLTSLSESDAVPPNDVLAVDVSLNNAFSGDLRENMSLIFLRLSNSVMSRPDMGSRYSLLHSCFLIPS